MYRMIEINSDHRDYLRILWRFSPHEKLQEYRLKTLPFGLNCSPYLAIRTLQQLSNDHPELCMARELIFNNTYVDDISGGDDSMEGALSKIDEIITLCRKGGFELRKWLSNDKRLLENLPATHAVNNVPVLNLNLDSTFQKILGLNWNSSFDCFSFSNLDITPTCTKRSILSCVARIFDPLGYLTPCIISLKILIQTLWCQGKSWDSNPGDDICNKFSKFRKEIHYFSELRIPRYFDSILNHRCDLIGFCDSSESAYCAVVYVRIYYENASKTFFVCAKSKVAPIKKLSIPRLELCAAVLLSKLILFVTNSYENIIKFSNTYAFSDSTVALTWIKSSPHKWKNFVSNRTSYIQDIIPPERWFYVASEHNPADVGTRGISPAALVSCSLWLDGPSSQFIDSESNYEYNSIEYEVINESAKSCLVTYVPEEDFVNVLLYKFSSLPKILRIICYILRFITNLKLESKNERVYTNNAITSSELHNALKIISKTVQQSVFHREIELLSSKGMIPKAFRKLSPFIDETGLLRVGGRLSHSNLPYDGKHPILLPRKHVFTELLILYIHNNFLHAGINSTLFHLMQMFWIYSAKRTIRSVISKCHQCFKTSPKSFQPIMGDLPKFRVSGLKPFVNTGVDLAGPISITMNRTRGAKILKAYLALFVCCATKAVHLELLSDLSAECFLMGFRRFLSRRGRCTNVYSDCGTNFIAASKYVKQIMQHASTEENICWHFNPPSSPHMGGIWEANIKSAKSHIIRVIGCQILTYEELNTLVARVEAVLNSRPLCPISTDPNDLSALTPGHFLTLEPLVTLPDPDYTNINLNRLSRWQLIVKLHRDFWNRWSREYLHTLQQRSKWNTQSNIAKIGDMVLIKKENSPPLTWTLGRIVQLFQGKDGVARVASVKTSNSLFKRPLVKLCPLPLC
ncbi:hypothetical protein WA026_003831 [Henosepilachna vigintioctopunctata]|uniref:Integrase catalytic domain-containing protein n=1 Tax=Henosepilachna vigintioctopunctata TaxID=420089 RepID=A0AAW1UEH8_9CUCU